MKKIVLAGACVVSLFGAAAAQHDGHNMFHAYYQSWVNRANKGCCNDRDCRPLPADYERTDAEGNLEVLVEGVGVARGTHAWCPVRSQHYLSHGNAPNWSTSHVCVTDFYKGTTPCEQLVCYQPNVKS